jgi:hypothetical protein
LSDRRVGINDFRVAMIQHCSHLEMSASILALRPACFIVRRNRIVGSPGRKMAGNRSIPCSLGSGGTEQF